MTLAYYNENDPFAAKWLENLSEAGHIARGRVDGRPIQEVTADDVRGVRQAHFFAGVGCWSAGLRLAGWPDDRSVWTGSCPCQPFSQAGRRGGLADERHLWPEWFRLIGECRPDVIFGEQVASADGLGWLDVVLSDLERIGYACGAADLPACGVAAPHLRQRLWFVALRHADADATGQRVLGIEELPNNNTPPRDDADGRCADGGAESALADAIGGPRRARSEPRSHRRSTVEPRGPRAARVVGDADGSERDRGMDGAAELPESGRPSTGSSRERARPSGLSRDPWSDCDWVWCTDGKWRPVEPGTFPLSHRSPARVGRLRAYGNALSPQVAATFIQAVMQTIGETT